MTEIMYMPVWLLPLLVFLPAAAIFKLMTGLRTRVDHQHISKNERDWSVPDMCEDNRSSFMHQWDVRFKITTIITYCFIISSLTHLASTITAIGISLILLIISKTAIKKVLFRILALTGFLSKLFMIMPFTVPIHPGDAIFVFGEMHWLQLNFRGLILASIIASKAIAIALLMEPLLSTAPLPVTLHGLSRLGFPEMLAQMILLSYRYLHVFSHEARRMSSAMIVRGFSKRTNLETLKTLANFLGMLFIRSFERTEAVFIAMKARGYKGRFPAPADLNLRATDIFITTIWIALGAALIIYDRIIL